MSNKLTTYTKQTHTLHEHNHTRPGQQQQDQDQQQLTTNCKIFQILTLTTIEKLHQLITILFLSTNCNKTVHQGEKRRGQ